MISAGIRRAVKAAVVGALFAPLFAPLTPWLGAQAPAAHTDSAASLRVYGPGGPAPAMREAAARFGARKGITVIVTAGP
ncbi:MAG: hypothetical protein Q8K55_01675, partial [Gemmatimonadaceae bacterium]|nr:hypothetical protein [Gemmatimonadaceae bacterium]